MFSFVYIPVNYLLHPPKFSGHNKLMYLYFEFQIFGKVKATKIRSMFGMPLHSIASHFAIWYRIAPLRSINAEEKERVFKDVKVATNNASNHHHDNVVTNSLIRYQEKKKKDDPTSSFERQDSSVSPAYRKLPARNSTEIPIELINKHPTAFSAHRKRIADYLVTDTWHFTNDAGCLTFVDGDQDPDYHAKPIKRHFRYETTV